MPELIVISNKKYNGTDHKSRSFKIELLLEQKQVLDIVDGIEEEPEDTTELKSCKK